MPELLFTLASYIAVAGWLALIAAILTRRPLLRDRIAGLYVPLILSLGYTLIIAVHWWSAEGGFGSLADVQRLSTSPWIALGGWVHYLAYDLFIGALMARRMMERGLSRRLLIPVLPLCFLFGPIGFLVAESMMLARKEARP